MQNYDPQEKENKWGEPFNHPCILPEDMCQTRECKAGREISRQSMVVLSELRKVGSKSREPAIAGNCGASSREEGAKQKKSCRNVHSGPLSLC